LSIERKRFAEVHRHLHDTEKGLNRPGRPRPRPQVITVNICRRDIRDETETCDAYTYSTDDSYPSRTPLGQRIGTLKMIDEPALLVEAEVTQDGLLTLGAEMTVEEYPPGVDETRPNLGRIFCLERFSALQWTTFS
jgi:hypothetical protein